MIMIDEEEVAHVADARESKQQVEEVETEDMIASLTAMFSNVGWNILRVRGKMIGKEIFLLIDSGSTHCFMDEKVTQSLGCRVEYTTLMMVSVVDRSKLISRTNCPDFSWRYKGTNLLIQLEWSN